jgi:hypothetical protein
MADSFTIESALPGFYPVFGGPGAANGMSTRKSLIFGASPPVENAGKAGGSHPSPENPGEHPPEHEIFP